MCTHPYILYTNGVKNEKTRKSIFYFRKYDAELLSDLIHSNRECYLIPCGRCVECRLEYRKQWSVRLLNELEYSKNAYFLTLTYDDQHLPKGGTLVKDDLKRFFNSLKKHFPKLKYYACGEYGEKFNRPHYHAIIFNVDDSDFTNLFPYDDRLIYKYSHSGEKLFYSPTIQNVWRKGFTDLGKVNFNSCSYVAGYVQKKLYGDYSKLYDDKKIIPPFSICSNGIGKSYFMDNKDTIIKTNEIFYIKKNKVYKCSIPRYYQKLLEKYFPNDFEKIKVRSKNFANTFISDILTLSYKEQKEYFINNARKSLIKDLHLIRK